MSKSDNSSEVGQDEQRGHCEERLHDRPQRRLQLGQAGGGGGDRDRQRVLAAGQPGTYLWIQNACKMIKIKIVPEFEALTHLVLGTIGFQHAEKLSVWCALKCRKKPKLGKAHKLNPLLWTQLPIESVQRWSLSFSMYVLDYLMVIWVLVHLWVILLLNGWWNLNNCYLRMIMGF